MYLHSPTRIKDVVFKYPQKVLSVDIDCQSYSTKYCNLKWQITCVMEATEARVSKEHKKIQCCAASRCVWASWISKHYYALAVKERKDERQESQCPLASGQGRPLREHLQGASKNITNETWDRFPTVHSIRLRNDRQRAFKKLPIWWVIKLTDHEE